MVVRPQRFLYFGNVSNAHLGKKKRSWKGGEQRLSGVADICAPWKRRLDNPVCLAELDLRSIPFPL